MTSTTATLRADQQPRQNGLTDWGYLPDQWRLANVAYPHFSRQRLGHASIRLTLDTYGHLLPGLDEQLRDDLDQAHFKALAACTRPEGKQVVPFEPTKTEEPPAKQGVLLERTTRFEPATLTLAR